MLRPTTAPRLIICRKTLLTQLEALYKEFPNATIRRQEILSLFKETLSKGRTEIEHRFYEHHDGAQTVHENAFLIDQIIRCLYDYARETEFKIANPTEGERLAVIAVGGYGRGEMAPYSDVDLLFLSGIKSSPSNEQVIEYILYLLWDLKLKVGQAVRTIQECVKRSLEDVTIATSLVEARYIWGDKSLFEQLQTAYRHKVQAVLSHKFIDLKLQERDQRHEKMGGSRYVVEPNIKDGKGGLRDLHTLYWIAKFLYAVSDIDQLVDQKIFQEDEIRTFEKAHRFHLTIRCMLHYLSKRGEDRLTFDLQRQIAEKMMYMDRRGSSGIERFMKHYYLIAKDIGDLTRVFCAALDAQHKRTPLNAFRQQKLIKGFPVEDNRLLLPQDQSLSDAPLLILHLFHIAQQHRLDIHPNALRLIHRHLRCINHDLRQNPLANQLFLEMLTSSHNPETCLRRLNEAGVFGRFIPDFGRVVAQMQFDMYHIYTVDEHTIRAIGILHQIELGNLKEELPVASEIIHKVNNRIVLYVAVLLHDIAKGRGGDHSILGAEVAKTLCPRLGLDAAETESVAWLVEQHLLLSNVAFRRDLEDPKTVQDLVEIIQSPERLRLLLVLTVCDIRAVGPKTWTPWKASLLRRLYQLTNDALDYDLNDLAIHRHTLIEQAKQAFEELAQTCLSNPAEIKNFLELGSPSYWLTYKPETKIRHLKLLRSIEQDDQKLVIQSRVNPKRAMTKITILAQDHPGLLPLMAGALAASGASIIASRIFTLANGIALDTFTIVGEDGKPIEKSQKLNRLTAMMHQAVEGQLNIADALQRHQQLYNDPTSHFEVPARVIIDNSASHTYSVIEINALDRPGLLYSLTKTLTDLQLQIHSAKISTYGERAVDVFYVKDLFGHKMTHKTKLNRVKQTLLHMLQGLNEEKYIIAPAITPFQPPEHLKIAP